MTSGKELDWVTAMFFSWSHDSTVCVALTHNTSPGLHNHKLEARARFWCLFPESRLSLPWVYLVNKSVLLHSCECMKPWHSLRMPQQFGLLPHIHDIKISLVQSTGVCSCYVTRENQFKPKHQEINLTANLLERLEKAASNRGVIYVPIVDIWN